jgi:hypothetical protein
VPVVATPPCPVRVVGKRIVGAGGRVVYRYPGNFVPHAQIRCSGRTVWVLLQGGVASSQELYLGLRSADGGRTIALLLSEPYFGIKAPHTIDSYSGPWTIVGVNAAYFVGWCPACGRGTVSLTYTLDGGRIFHRLRVPALTGSGARLRSIRVDGRRATIVAGTKTATLEIP